MGVYYLGPLSTGHPQGGEELRHQKEGEQEENRRPEVCVVSERTGVANDMPAV
jgi:hypothetical protein